MKHEMSNIDSLVDKFWNGEISEQEEELLKSLKDNPSFKIKHPGTAKYFSSIDTHKRQNFPEENKNQLLKSVSESRKLNTSFYWISGLAASLALTIWLSVSGNKNEYSQEEIQFAYEQTKETLLLVSSKMEEGRNETLNLRHFDNSKKELIKEIQLN